MTESISRRILCQKVSKKNSSINYLHVQSVVNILLEEILVDIINKKIIMIGGLGKIFLKQLGPRKHFNIHTKCFDIAPGNKILRFEIDKKFRQILIDNLDIAKTFPDVYNER